MSKFFCSLGLMSGTSMDGVDASIIQSDGESKYKDIMDKYFEYPKDIYKNLTKAREKIQNSKDLKKLSKELKILEKSITLFHAKVVNELIKESKSNIDLIGFHGQTIFHNAKEKISKQLGDGKLLSKLTNKIVVYNFRKNDLKNGGNGAPLTPIFHKLIAKQHNINLPVNIINIGGITNITTIGKENLKARDLGPGSCLIDLWIRLNSKKKYDENGNIGKKGKIKETIFKEAENIYYNRNQEWKNLSYDVNDFNSLIDIFYGLSLEDGSATITELTSSIISDTLTYTAAKENSLNIICGGGRKNSFLLSRISNNIKTRNKKKLNVKNFQESSLSEKLISIDVFGINGDFLESQAFAFLAIRSYLNLPISFPETTGANIPCTGGIIIKN